jgi:hypothetical protein
MCNLHLISSLPLNAMAITGRCVSCSAAAIADRLNQSLERINGKFKAA